MLGEAASFSEVGKDLFERGVGGGVVEVACVVGKFLGEVFPIGCIDGAEAGKLIDACFHFLAEFVVGFRATGEADNGVVCGESPFVLQAEKGRDEFAGGEIATGSKDDHDEWWEDAGWWGRGFWGGGGRTHD